MTRSIVAVGEVLWDLLPAGKQLGGAPANFIYRSRLLGADARLVTRVGGDDLGREVLEYFEVLGLPTEPVQVDRAFPTGTVAVALDPDGQPRFTIGERVAWDHIEADERSLAMVAAADAVCFGTLAQRCETSRLAIRSLVSASRSGALRIFDVNLRPPFVDFSVIEESLGLANALKLNDHELGELATMFGLRAGVREAMAELADRFELSLVALTRGGAGALLLADGVWSDHPGLTVAVCDTIGAGDAFTAALVSGVLEGRPLDAINHHANQVAALVCSRPGGISIVPDALESPKQVP